MSYFRHRYPPGEDLWTPKQYQEKLGLTFEDLFSRFYDCHSALPKIVVIADQLLLDMNTQTVEQVQLLIRTVQINILSRIVWQVRNRHKLLSLGQFMKRYHLSENDALRGAVSGDLPPAVVMCGRIYFQITDADKWTSAHRKTPYSRQGKGNK